MLNFASGMCQVDPRVWEVPRPLVQAQIQAKGAETWEKAKGEEGEKGEGEERTQTEGKSW